jgi:hypothetical protein
VGGSEPTAEAGTVSRSRSTTMRVILIAVLGIVLTLGPGLAVATGQTPRHVEKAGGFSYVPPKGWKVFDNGSAAFMKTTDDTIDKQVKEIKKQLAAAPPGSVQAKALQQALDVLQKIQKQAQEMTKVVKQIGVEDNFKGFMPAAADGPSAALSFTVDNLPKMPRKTVDGKPVEMTLADVIASHKQPPIAFGGRENETFKVVAEKKLKTDAGAECVVVVTEMDLKGVSYRNIACVLELPGQRILTANGWAAVADNLDAVYEATFKSLRVEKR